MHVIQNAAEKDNAASDQKRRRRSVINRTKKQKRYKKGKKDRCASKPDGRPFVKMAPSVRHVQCAEHEPRTAHVRN